MGKPNSSQAEELAGVEDIGLSHKQVHEARTVRDAERDQPGIVRKAIEDKLKIGKEPTRADVNRAIAPAPAPAAVPAPATLPRVSISEVVKKVFPLLSRLKATYFGEHGYGILSIDLKRLAKIASDAKSLLHGWADEVLTEKLGPLFDVVRNRSQGRDDRSNADLMMVTSQGLRLLDEWSPGCTGRAQQATDKAEVKTLQKKVQTLQKEMLRLQEHVAELEEKNVRLKSDLEARRARRPS